MEFESRWAKIRPEKPGGRTCGPNYYRHWGSNYGNKPAVGIGHFALWQNRFLEGPPKPMKPISQQGPKKRRKAFTPEMNPPTPTVAGDWEDEIPQPEGWGEVQRRPTPRVEAQLPIEINEPPRQISALVAKPRPTTGRSEKHGRVGGIVPIASSETPTFGYGIPAVLKPLPPCAIATAAVEIVDIPAGERFQSTYQGDFRKIPLTGAFQTPEYFPVRFVPAANRHCKEIALNVLGAHVARKG